MSFLTAEWRKLILVNYLVDPARLSRYVPPGTEPDVWLDRCYISLVGFMFLHTRVLGIPVPFHINFEEVNLRFYVRRRHGDQWKRGVVFIKELVPRPALAFVANHMYKEHYQAVPMRHHWNIAEETLDIEYSWKMASKWQHISVKASSQSQVIRKDSEVEFITEHYWGYTRRNSQSSLEYEVTHPTWRHYPILKHETLVDFESTYGPEFAFLSQTRPFSVMLAEGSPISVERAKRIS